MTSVIATETGVFNVKDYGAVGDGVADDTAAIQSALDTAPAQSTIFFPKGTYKITSPLNVKYQGSYNGNPADGTWALTRLKGIGEGSQIKAGQSGMSAMVTVNGSYVYIEDLFFEGYSEANRTDKAIHVNTFGTVGLPSAVKHVVIADCRFLFFNSVVYSKDAEDIFVDRNWASSCLTLFRADDCGMGSAIRNNTFNGAGIGAGGPAILFQRVDEVYNPTYNRNFPTGQQAEGVTITGNTLICAGGDGIVVKGGLDFIIEQNMIGEVNGWGIVLDGRGARAVVGTKINSNWIGGRWDGSNGATLVAQGAIRLLADADWSAVQFTRITGNEIKGFAGCGISLEGATGIGAGIDDTVITENNFLHCGNAHIDVKNARRTRIRDNAFQVMTGDVNTSKFFVRENDHFSDSTVTGNTFWTENNALARSVAKSNASVWKDNYGLADFVKTQSKLRGVTLRRNSGQATTSGVGMNVVWDATVMDTENGAMWSASNPTRITIPNGVTHVNIMAQVEFSTSGAPTLGMRHVTLMKNGGVFVGRGFRIAPDVDPSYVNTEYVVAANSGLIPVSPGDYFEVQVLQNSGQSNNVRGTENTYFTVQFVG